MDLCVYVCFHYVSLFACLNNLMNLLVELAEQLYLSVSPGIAPFCSRINISIHLLLTLLAWTIRGSVFDGEFLLG